MFTSDSIRIYSRMRSMTFIFLDPAINKMVDDAPVRNAHRRGHSKGQQCIEFLKKRWDISNCTVSRVGKIGVQGQKRIDQASIKSTVYSLQLKTLECTPERKVVLCASNDEKNGRWWSYESHNPDIFSQRMKSDRMQDPEIELSM